MKKIRVSVSEFKKAKRVYFSSRFFFSIIKNSFLSKLYVSCCRHYVIKTVYFCSLKAVSHIYNLALISLITSENSFKCIDRWMDDGAC